MIGSPPTKRMRMLGRYRLPRPHPMLIWLLVGGIFAYLLATLPLTLAIALVGGLIVVALTLIEPAFGLYAAIVSVPVQETIQLPAGLTVTQAAVALAFGAWTLRVMAYPERRLHLRLLAPWLIFLAVQLASIVFTPYSQIEGIKQFARWVAAFLVFVLTLGTITSRRRAWGLIAALLIGPLSATLLGLYQFVTPKLSPPSFAILGNRFARASATFGQPNPFAGYLNMAWPLAVALGVYFLTRLKARTQTRHGDTETWRHGDRVTRRGDMETWRHGENSVSSAPGLARFWSPPLLVSRSRLSTTLVALVFGGVTLLLLAGLFASYSRGGWIGAVVGVGAMAVVAGRRTAALAGVVVLLGLLIGLLGAFSVLPPALTNRLQPIVENLRIFDAGEVAVTPENFAIVERMAQWQAGWRMFRAYQLLGVGAGNYNSAYPDFFVSPWKVSQGHAHNYYIQSLAESGIFGLLAYMLLIGAMVREALRTRQRLRGTVWGAAAVGVCGIIAAVAGHNVFENLHVLNLGIQLSGVWALAIVVQRWGATDTR